MAIVSRFVQAEFIELKCGHCDKGVFRLKHPPNEYSEKWLDPVTIQCAPTIWDSACHHCGHESGHMTPGPFLMYKGRKFVLYDSVTEKITAMRALMRRIADGR